MQKELRRIAWAPNFEEFNSRLEAFLASNAHMPAYIIYFNNQWLKRVQFADWALFTRVKGIPTGDQQLEAWHRHLKTTVLLHSMHLRIDRLLITLWKEFDRVASSISSPQLRAQLVQQREADHRRYLENAYCPADPPAAYALPSPPAAPTPTPTQPEPTALVTPTAMPSPPVIPPTLPELLLTPATNSNGKRAANLINEPGIWARVMGKRITRSCPCGAAQVNCSCTFSLCRSCCAQRQDLCLVTAHNTSKLVASPFRSIVADAIHESTTIWVRYIGGTAPGMVRAVMPRRWVIEPSSFIVLCLREKIEKKYYLNRITEARNDQFE